MFEAGGNRLAIDALKKKDSGQAGMTSKERSSIFIDLKSRISSVMHPGEEP
jgi:hypothetical protein